MKNFLALILIFAVPALQAEKISPVEMSAYEASASKSLKEISPGEAKNSTISVTVAWGYDIKMRVTDERKLTLAARSTIAEAAIAWQKQTGESLMAPAYGKVVLLRRKDAGVERMVWSVAEARGAGKAFLLQDGDFIISVGHEVY